MKAWPFYPLTKTRYSAKAVRDFLTGELTEEATVIYFGRNAKGKWRFVVDCAGFAEVGQQYETKAELLADLPAYAKSWGF